MESGRPSNKGVHESASGVCVHEEREAAVAVVVVCGGQNIVSEDKYPNISPDRVFRPGSRLSKLCRKIGWRRGLTIQVNSMSKAWC